MKFKALVVAAVTALSSLGASAIVFSPAQTSDAIGVSGSFSEQSLGEFTLTTASNIIGALGFGVGDVEVSVPGFGNFFVPLSPVTFTSLSLTGLTPGSTAVSSGSALPSFSFYNLAAGTYEFKVSGNVAGGNAVLAQYTITAVPEPETAAMLLAGLVMMGTIARRRNAAQLQA